MGPAVEDEQQVENRKTTNCAGVRRQAPANHLPSVAGHQQSAGKPERQVGVDVIEPASPTQGVSDQAPQRAWNVGVDVLKAVHHRNHCPRRDEANGDHHSRQSQGQPQAHPTNMAFFWNRPFFSRRPEKGPATSAIGLHSASAPVAISPSNRHLPSSNNWAMVTLFGTIAVLYFAREILIPLAFALILTFVLTPVVAILERSRIGRVPSVAVTVLVTIAAAGCIAGIIAIQLVNAAQELPRYRQNIQAKMAALRIPTTGPFGLAQRCHL